MLKQYMEHDWYEPMYLWGRHTCKRCGVTLIDSERLIPCGTVDTSFYILNGKIISRHEEPKCLEKDKQ